MPYFIVSIKAKQHQKVQGSELRPEDTYPCSSLGGFMLSKNPLKSYSKPNLGAKSKPLTCLEANQRLSAG
jgi:hypothetical protein